MPWGITPVHIIAALGVALIVIGPRKLPGLGALTGRRVRELRSSLTETRDSFVSEATTTPASDAPAAGQTEDPARS